jgi:hypothetical protein
MASVVAAFVATVVGIGCSSPAAMPDAPLLDAQGPQGPGLAGVLVDYLGRPRPATDVLACMATTCLYGTSGSGGRFSFSIDPPAQVALKTHPDLTKTPRYAAALVPVVLADGALVDAGTLYTPDLPAGVVLGPATSDPQTVAPGDDLELTLNRADMTAPLGEFLNDVAARRLPAEHVPAFPELAGREVIAVYAMHPFTAKSSSPVSVRVPSSLADGSPVVFQTASEIDGVLSAPVQGHVSGGIASTDPGLGILRFTYLVVSRP